jgi:DNA (cytosine-5)-methyltransferase 1
LNYLSVCSGIEAATVAWHELGWNPVGFGEIEKFPSEVLAHHYPDVPNFGDMTKFKEWNINGTVGLLVGGTPCQSFSVAGLRKGLTDPRGNLALTYCGILDHFRPKWFVWENVPGVLSSNKGRDFGSFLGALVELGYGFSYRVLDAQYFGVAQRRKRVFVVGHIGDWQPTAKVLFESESLCGNSKASRKSWQEVAATITARFGASRNNFEEIAPFYSSEKSATLTASGAGFSRPGQTSTAHENYIAIQGNLIGRDKGGPQGIGVAENSPMYTLTKSDVHGVANNVAVRRLTPVECERLQGFPDNYTNIKENCPDGPRYKALGNSMAVPVMKWIGNRIQMVEDGLI